MVVATATPPQRRSRDHRSILENIKEQNPAAPSIEDLVAEIEASIPLLRQKVYKGDIKELPGEPMTRDMLGDMETDPRDDLSKDRRLQEYDDLQFRHMWHLKNKPPEHEHFSHLMHGDMGGGKTLSVVDESKQLYSKGIPVFHNASLYFGQRLRTEEIATFTDILTNIFALVVDEIHDLISRYAANAAVARMFGISGTAMLRKIGGRLLSASVHEGELPHSYKASIDWSIQCQRFYPRSGAYIAPPWSYVMQRRWGPRPHRYKGIADEWNVLEASKKVRMQTRLMHPYRMWTAAHLYDSFELVELGQGYRLTSQKLRQSLENRAHDASSLAILECFVRIINSGWNPKSEQVHWKRFATQCYQVGELTPEITRPEIRDALVEIIEIDRAKFRWEDFVAEFDDARMEPNPDYRISEEFETDEGEFTILTPDDQWKNPR